MNYDMLVNKYGPVSSVPRSAGFIDFDGGEGSLDYQSLQSSSVSFESRREWPGNSKLHSR